jgi:hypothetical protein
MKTVRALRRLLLTAAHIGTDLACLALNGRVLLVSAYRRSRGCDEEFITRYGSAFGRAAAKAHRVATGTEPMKGWSVSTGKLRRVFVYLDTAALDAGWDAYPRTRDYVPATGTCAWCLREWGADDLTADGNGDPVRVDCHAGDPSAEDTAAYRRYALGVA